jgi:hypothetical protein
MRLNTRLFCYLFLPICVLTTKAFSQKSSCKPPASVALDYDAAKLGFINDGYDNFIVDDTINLQSDKIFTVKAEFNSYSVYKICLLTDPSVDATGFELDDNSGSPLDFTSNYGETDKNNLIYDFGPEPGGDYYLKFKAIKKNGQPTCAFIMVMQKKVPK